MDADIGEPLRHWFVAFVSADRIRVHRWLKLGFQHCFAFAWDEAAGRWVVFDPGFACVYIRPIDDALAGALWAHLHGINATVLACDVEAHPLFRPRLMVTCVTAIAALLGLRRCYAVTPYQLFRSLRARGAAIVMAPDSGDLHGSIDRGPARVSGSA